MGWLGEFQKCFGVDPPDPLKDLQWGVKESRTTPILAQWHHDGKGHQDGGDGKRGSWQGRRHVGKRTLVGLCWVAGALFGHPRYAEAGERPRLAVLSLALGWHHTGGSYRAKEETKHPSVQVGYGLGRTSVVQVTGPVSGKEGPCLQAH